MWLAPDFPSISGPNFMPSTRLLHSKNMLRIIVIRQLGQVEVQKRKVKGNQQWPLVQCLLDFTIWPKAPWRWMLWTSQVASFYVFSIWELKWSEVWQGVNQSHCRVKGRLSGIFPGMPADSQNHPQTSRHFLMKQKSEEEEKPTQEEIRLSRTPTSFKALSQGRPSALSVSPGSVL